MQLFDFCANTYQLPARQTLWIAWLLTAKIGHILRQIVEFDRIRRERARLTRRHFDKCRLSFLTNDAAVVLNKFMLAIRHCDLNGRRGGVRLAVQGSILWGVSKRRC